MSTIGINGDYASPKLWEAALLATLAEQEIARVIDNLSYLSDLQKTFDIGAITSVNNGIVIEAWEGASNEPIKQDFKAINGSVPVISYGRGGTFGLITIRNGCNHITVRNLSVEVTANASNTVLDARSTFAADQSIKVENIYQYLNGGFGSVTLKPSAKGHVKNCILIVGNTNGLASATDIIYENNTIVGHIVHTDIARSGIRYNQSVTKNNVVFNFGPTSGYKCYLTNGGTFEQNASSDGSGTSGLQNLILAEQYEDPTHHDWNLKAGSSLIGAAIDGSDIGALIGSEPVHESIALELQNIEQPVSLSEMQVYTACEHRTTKTNQLLFTYSFDATQSYIATLSDTVKASNINEGILISVVKADYVDNAVNHFANELLVSSVSNINLYQCHTQSIMYDVTLFEGKAHEIAISTVKALTTDVGIYSLGTFELHSTNQIVGSEAIRLGSLNVLNGFNTEQNVRIITLNVGSEITATAFDTTLKTLNSTLELFTAFMPTLNAEDVLVSSSTIQYMCKSDSLDYLVH